MKKRLRASYLSVLALILVLVTGFLYLWRHKSSIRPQGGAAPESDKATSSEQPVTSQKQTDKEKSAEELLSEAKETYQKKELEQAEAIIQEAANKAKTAEIYNLWGNILRDQGKKDEAKAKYREAISIDKHFVVAYLNLATLYQEAEEYDKALEVVNEGLKYNPSNQELLNSKNLIEVLKLRSQ